MPHYGFNFLWMFSWAPGVLPAPPDERALDFIARHGFNFVRLPLDYRFWTRDFDYLHPDEDVFQYLDTYLAACQGRGIHCSLNLHRAPGYCINGTELERHSLWTDIEAQQGFIFTWETLARRYQGIPASQLSFDLLNEPPEIGRRGFSRENHAMLMRQVVQAIRAIDPQREIVLNGVNGGGEAIPELADLGVVHSGRGYQPMALTHYQAGWWRYSAGLAPPDYPGTHWDGQAWDKAALRNYYQPWLDVEKVLRAKTVERLPDNAAPASFPPAIVGTQIGNRVHIGEFGCYNQVENEIALRWFADLISLYQEFGWGYSLWNFAGPFGIIEHGRPGTRYEQLDGFATDRALLELLRQFQLKTA